MKHTSKDFIMNRKTLSAACLTALIGLPGCALFNKPAEPEAQVPYDTQQQYCPGGVCDTDPFINYTQTRAPFRQEGELSPRDRLVSQSGAGNNLSASIPPSIEDEVINYETQVETQSAQEVQPTAEMTEQKTADNTDISTSNKTDVSTADEANNAVPDKQAAQTDNQPAGENTPVAQTQTAEQPASEATPEEVVVSQEVLTEEPTVETDDDQTDDEGEDAVRDWYAEEGQNLKALLTEWSEQSGWRLVWNTNRNYVLNAGAMFRGRFADVSSALIRAFARARPAPVATFYKGNRVLVVETMEDENAFD